MQIYAMISKENATLLPIFSTDILYLEPSSDARIIETKKSILLIVRKEDWQGGPVDLVEKMMKACKLEHDQYDVFPCEGPVIRLKQVQGEKLDTIISFGVQFDSEFFRLNKKTYTPFRFHRFKWLLADSLSELMKQEMLKARLWKEGLKPLFGI